MMIPHRPSARTAPGALVLVASTLVASGAAHAAAFIRVEGVPESLVFPISEGRNIVVTATVHGVATESAWLAADASSGLRVMLAPVGEDQYQVNLAADDVAAVVQAAKRKKRFKIFARTTNGKIVSSVAIRFASARTRYVYPRRIAIADRDGTRRRELTRWGTNWIDLDTAGRVIVEYDAGAVSIVEARAASGAWVFARGPDDGSFSLSIAGDVKTALEKGSTMAIYGGEWPSRQRICTLAAKPRALDLPKGSATFTVLQRRSRAIPGSREYLHLRLGDITGGQVMTSIRTAGGDMLVEMESLQQGGQLTFVLGTTKYALELTKLMNTLFGDDWATFEVKPYTPDVDKLIEALLDELARSGVTFIRNGTPAGSGEAAHHLRKKYAAAGKKAESLEEFIDEYATSSSQTGAKYRVRLPDGTTTDAGPWLKELAANKKD